MRQRGFRFIEILQFRTDFTTFLKHSQLGIHPAQSLAASNCQAIVFIVIKVAVQGHTIGKGTPIVGTGPERIQMRRKVGLRGPHIEDTFLRNWEKDLEISRLSGSGRVHNNGQHFPVPFSLNGGTEFPIAWIGWNYPDYPYYGALQALNHSCSSWCCIEWIVVCCQRQTQQQAQH